MYYPKMVNRTDDVFVYDCTYCQSEEEDPIFNLNPEEDFFNLDSEEGLLKDVLKRTLEIQDPYSENRYHRGDTDFRYIKNKIKNRKNYEKIFKIFSVKKKIEQWLAFQIDGYYFVTKKNLEDLITSIDLPSLEDLKKDLIFIRISEYRNASDSEKENVKEHFLTLISRIEKFLERQKNHRNS